MKDCIKVFIDGREGTTGLQIDERLAGLPVEILAIDPEKRKDAGERKKLLNAADVVFLCLPDTASREAVALLENQDTVVIDASTAHRTDPAWVYGFPELSAVHYEGVKNSNRIAVPGCHASGFCALVYPLVQAGLIDKAQDLSCFSLTGYSGGGKAMIAEYESEAKPTGARPYALALKHKHLPEMQAVCGLEKPPVFVPVLADVKQGMLVQVPLSLNAETLHNALARHYAEAQNVRVKPFGGAEDMESGRLAMDTLNGTSQMEIFVFGHETQALLVARLDNLGKGASGAAVQCMELRMDLD